MLCYDSNNIFLFGLLVLRYFCTVCTFGKSVHLIPCQRFKDKEGSVKRVTSSYAFKLCQQCNPVTSFVNILAVGE